MATGHLIRQANQFLEHHASADPDADVSIQALEMLRNIRMGDLGKLLRSRLDEAKRSGDSAGAVKLAEEEDKHFKWTSDIQLPFFLRVPPRFFQ